MKFASLETTTEPDDSVVPFDLATAKNHLRVDHTYDDDDITELVIEGVNAIERITGRMLRPASYQLRLSGFDYAADTALVLPRPPFSSLTSIHWVDMSGIEVEMAATSYDVHGEFPAIVMPSLASGNCWPYTATQLSAVRINFTGGYASGSVPKRLVRALKVWIDMEYNDHAPQTSNRMLQRFKDIVSGYVIHHPGLAGITQ